jgi:iron complex transport system ATP-binding protein
MSQSQVLVFDFLVKEIIEMGWIDRGISSYAKYFKTAMTDIIRECDIEPLLNQTFNTLSGGEQRRIHFARTLLQLWRPSDSNDPRYLLLDEPTANLDLSYEVKLLNIIKNKAELGYGVLLIIHDINLAAKFSNKIALFNEGSLFAFGAPEEVLKSEILSEVYQIPIEVDNDLLTIKYY